MDAKQAEKQRKMGSQDGPTAGKRGAQSLLTARSSKALFDTFYASIFEDFTLRRDSRSETKCDAVSLIISGCNKNFLDADRILINTLNTSS